MSNSSLVSYTRISPNKTVMTGKKNDRITPHCVVGQVTVERLGEIFAPTSKQASSNYGIGYDGRIAMYVEEKDRSWCSSSSENDSRAVTIEIASDTTDPYAITDKAYDALVKLCADICKRNGKTKLLWFGDKNKTLNYTPKSNEMVFTVHRWFANKACPGDYIYNRLGQIADEVNALLGTGSTSTPPSDNQSTSVNYTVRVDVTDLRIRKGPGTDYGINGYTGKGIFTIVEEAQGPGSTKGWGKLKSGAGWISLDYANRQSTNVSASTSDDSFKVQINYADLRIRKGPGTSYEANGFTGKGVFTIVEVKNGQGSTKGWGKLKSGAGWISLDYAKKL